MKLLGKRILIGSQIFVILAFFAGMLLNYFSLSPVMEGGETARITSAVDKYLIAFSPSMGVDVRNKAQLDSTLAANVIPYDSDMIFMDGDGGIIYSSSGYSGNGFEVIAESYGCIASDMISAEKDGPDYFSSLVYDDTKGYSYFGRFEQSSDIFYFAAIDYRISGRDVIRTFHMLLLVMALGGILVIIACYLTVRRVLGQIQKESLAEKELENASEIQMAMMPRSERHLIQMDIDAKLIPARKVGGDFYCYTVSGGKLYFCIGDVSGKGIPASLFMSKAVTLFRSFARSDMSAAQIASNMNIEMCINNHINMFITAIVGCIRISDGTMTYVNAGHEFPVIWDGNPDSRPYFLKGSGNVPLGVIEQSEYTEDSFKINKGAFVLLYTDGISEAKSTSKSFIGKNSILDIVDLVKTRSAKEINNDLVDSIKVFEEGMEQSDDIALLTFKNIANVKTLSLKNSLTELRKLPGFLEDIFKEFCFDHKSQRAIRTGLDEALTNCVLYAYPTQGESIDVNASIEDDCLCFEIRDGGCPFNPLEYKAPESEELKVGGLGISIIKKCFDVVRYSREGEYNVLKLLKHIEIWK